MGRCTRDPEVRYSQGEKPMAIARFTLAVDRKYKKKGEDDTDFISCVAFGNRGEFAEKYLRQGVKIVVCGHIQTGSYTNRDGRKVYTCDVVVDEYDFAESKSVSQSQAVNTQPAPEPTPQGYSDGFMDVDLSSDELPFS